MTFASTEGTAVIRAAPQAFLTAFARRVEAGLLPHASQGRNQYRVRQLGSDRLRFRAEGWWTAFNVGLNDVELTPGPPGRVHYAIRYWQWAGSAIGLSAVIGVLLMMFFWILDIREYIEQHPRSAVPGLSLGQNAAIAWAMAVFWGFVWPWILIAGHKRPLRRLMERLITEVDAAAVDQRVP
jgi:hypothetical protein